ncbi:MAG: enoyl-CoA hydratase/isomerase family protein [Cytophagales bacterium]|jgi:methylglutaconyl-CoA hydratase|nr:enoyl-CoA hydratase/isomerase family protein [Cytophagales bacterium]MCA6389698.1 enoyl-CoA hydratase/isomerase family protein [Cytophagales bacterium]MCA6392590.1 enoyl-CoA hydratase/isomerase family protein [Cytophagales bacterium]MCA6400291.1 enoyl-CoA hydratase/isomerase family protein [Cytophagales bacterium]MCA6403603.1 enoyl-CoA hydratase/isomerase family protein [Cytophagales bacterium]
MSLVIYTVQDRVGYIALNRPEKRNALSGDMVTELKAAFARAEEDETVKVIVLKANGEAFCAGADLAYLQQLQQFSLEENLLDSNHLKDLFQQIYQLKKVVIAHVQGHALAGGCGLATICDFVFSTPEAKFGYTEVKIGFIPALVSVFLIRKIGEQKAKQLLLSGDLMQGEEAVRMGLVNYLFAKEELEQRVNSFAQFLIKNNSGQSMALTKQMIGEVQSMPLSEALAHAVEQNALARGSADCKKGIAAFLNKEDIVW